MGGHLDCLSGFLSCSILWTVSTSSLHATAHQVDRDVLPYSTAFSSQLAYGPHHSLAWAVHASDLIRTDPILPTVDLLVTAYHPL